MRYFFAFCLTFSLIALGVGAYAERPFTEQEVPGSLKPWVPWVTHNVEKNSCPYFYDRVTDHACLWPTSLSLDVTAKGGSFTYQVTVYDTPDHKPQRILLPGTLETWPQKVLIDKRSVPVLAFGDRPSVLLEEGAYAITGSFFWDSMPVSMRVPAAMGLVRLSVGGAEVAIPDIEGEQVWIQRNNPGEQAAKENRLEAKVFRKVTDDVPQFLETTIEFQVSGKQREEALGKVLPENVIPVSVESDLPARLESDGTLRMQLKPGTWQLSINARYRDAVSALSLPKRDGILPAQEIWSFEPRNQLRLVQVEGVDAIDPTQTELPDEWRNFPAYLMKRGSVLTLAEKKRGATETVPDQLSLAREIWLDFSGKGYTFQDSINGVIRQSSRLEVENGIELGNANINSRDQYITRLGNDGAAGVEVRDGPINMSAGSRIESGEAEFSATGWKSKFDHVSAKLYLPPGWSLFSYGGVDSVSYSWVSNWSLLDIFLVLLAVVAVFKLYDIRIALLALATLVLMQHELEGFTQMILLILATIALLRYLPRGNFHTVTTWFQRLVFLLLLVMILPFMVQHIRYAVYPQLDTGGHRIVHQSGGFTGSLAQDKFAEQENYGYHKEIVAADEPEKDASELSINGGLPTAPDMAPLPPPAPMAAAPAMAGAYGGRHRGVFNMNKKIYAKTMHLQRHAARAQNVITSFTPDQNADNYQQYSADTKLQTGYGSSTWRNNAVDLNWSGMVDSSVKLRLYLISAHENLVISLVRVILMVSLVALLLGAHLKGIKNILQPRVLAVILVGILLSQVSGTQASAVVMRGYQPPPSPPGSPTGDSDSGPYWVFPPESMLDDLKEKFEQAAAEPPACSPLCATIANTRITAAGDMLTVEQEVHAGGNVALPLPGGVSNWRPSVVMVDGKPATAMMQGSEGYLYINLDAGVHQVKLTGALPPARDTVGLSLPVLPHFTSADGNGWEIQGIHENGLADNSLQVIRTAKHTATQEKTLERTVIQPFFQLERTFVLAQQWQVKTVVHRITPEEDTAAVHVPLLPGETITTANIQVKDGEVYANFDAGSSEVSWDSVIRPGPSLNLTAAKEKPWVEIWRLTVSNLWHATATGIPRVYLSDNQGLNTIGNAANFWQWQPWPGESVNVDITRPTGVEGDTRTIDESNLSIIPGQRSTESTLILKIRSSLGGQHDVTLPDGAILTQVQQGGATLPAQLKGGVLTLPLKPGENAFTIQWKQDDPLPLSFKAPAIRHGLARSVNAEVTVDLPPSRWLLFAHGPEIGPAVLIWSWLIVILIVAYALGRLSFTPLRMRHWLLLLLGLNQAALFADFIVIAWLLALGLRSRETKRLHSAIAFNVVQVLLVLLTVVSLNLLFASITSGLLGSPDMHVIGGNSYGNHLHWYQDITGAVLPQPVVISVSIWAYRVLMLLWALWLAFAVVDWLRWGWRNFTDGGHWRGLKSREPSPSPPPPAG